mmetsp:Transcript_25461/g.68928  ORF Transcript_25461/g.68928 Transcript_25461/m.68928 type:complete len:270 (-) Transcript_25461:177-986(-)|eukprot:CAMPEP_0185188640 /NCGR_PEP_ID=MMETSP1140-20130426/5530_1 /TAXON_ID=298111 /ORGANISM="Pavlova sp., Strain CCMP459" /LENGTH=269 /DNA_ID=CAMNT_0027755153 /DNA_START=359 /DNA_END=1168 /DNA_ORIENTATION=-
MQRRLAAFARLAVICAITAGPVVVGTAPGLRLVYGNKCYSSWSMRAWLFLKHSGIPFDEERIDMYTEQGLKTLSRYSPTGCVPVLVDEDASALVWDSLAIVSYVQHKHSSCTGYPGHSDAARAHAMSIVAEAHSSFGAVRRYLPQNLRRRESPRSSLSDAVLSQVERLRMFWDEAASDGLRNNDAGGPWMYGTEAPTLTDLYLVPFALRLRSYKLGHVTEVESVARFLTAIDEDEFCRQWISEAQEETAVIAHFEGDPGDFVPAGTGDR